ncbi:MAG: hypothetical protein QNJ68_12955 [Microcoleaceae cyanobacterium MO_207.B10]|nr:hypothetical protein [Microcoleaceae cyanobacterium MO_207.B10]
MLGDCLRHSEAIAQKLFINYANLERVFGVGISRPNSWAVSIHCYIIIST